jgi:uncharacterized protein with HEPN domain
MPRDAKKICFDLLQAINGIIDFTGNLSFSDYQSNAMLRLAVERQYEIIGEAMRRLEVEFGLLFQKVTDGRKMINFRNALIHGYDVVSDDIVWSITQNNLTVLKVEITQIFEEL